MSLGTFAAFYCKTFCDARFFLNEAVAKLHGSEKLMIFDQVAEPGFAWLYRSDGGLLERAGRGERMQHGRKGRFCAPKSFATASNILKNPDFLNRAR